MSDMAYQISYDNMDAESANLSLGDYKKNLLSLDDFSLKVMVFETAVLNDSTLDNGSNVILDRQGNYNIDTNIIYKIRLVEDIKSLDLYCTEDMDVLSLFEFKGEKITFDLNAGGSLTFNTANGSIKQKSSNINFNDFKKIASRFKQCCDIFSAPSKESTLIVGMEL